MNKRRMVIYASLGSLISVLIWSFMGGCHTAPGRTQEPLPSESLGVPVETEEELIEEGILLEETGGISDWEEAPVSPLAAPLSPADQEERFYTVKKGDTLWSISRSYGVSLPQLQEANAITNPDRISIGQKLRIPR